MVYSIWNWYWRVTRHKVFFFSLRLHHVEIWEREIESIYVLFQIHILDRNAVCGYQWMNANLVLFVMNRLPFPTYSIKFCLCFWHTEDMPCRIVMSTENQQKKENERFSVCFIANRCRHPPRNIMSSVYSSLLPHLFIRCMGFVSHVSEKIFISIRMTSHQIHSSLVLCSSFSFM